MSDFLKQMRSSVLNRITERSMPEFMDIFSIKGPVIIAEVKFSSPSRGQIYTSAANHLEIAKEYYANGAAALSVLTEPEYFAGNLTYLNDISISLPQIPLLMKDFVLTKEQIMLGKLNGASAILLIVGFLSSRELEELYHFTLEIGLTPLIEIHSELELKAALKLNPKLIGINNRDLSTLSIDMNTSRKLIDLIPEDVTVICESGIDCAETLNEFSELGFDGFLIGTVFMKSHTPGIALRNLIQEVHHAS